MWKHAMSWAMAACAGTLWLPAGCQEAPKVYEMPRVQEEAASMRSPIVNLPAPDFTLANQEGKRVSLKDFRGQWVILYFYPKDDTPGCTCQAAEFSQLAASLKGMNTKIVGVSGDPVAEHEKFYKKFKLKVDLLSDPDHAVMRQYGAWVDARLGEKKYERIIRTTMIVNPQGVIRYHWPEVIPTGHAERVKEKLGLLQSGGK